MSVQQDTPRAPSARHPALSGPLPDRPLVVKPRRRRGLGLGILLIVLTFGTSAGVLLFCPPLLQAMSAVVLDPQPGAVPWNGRDRITIVAMGLTQRTTEPARTDTLLAMDVDPAHHRVSMLSVPRDLWVNIPDGYGQGKLAIAYAIGGPKLSAYTLERELGIPVDYTMSMTFGGFMKLVDAMGGVTVNVPQELKDATYPCLVGNAYCPIDIKAGAQHMDGATALEFVRERHAFAQQDLARVQDQQAFSEAFKRTLISPATWTRYPAILATLRQSITTNLPFNAFPSIALQYVLPTNHVTHSYINVDNGMVKPDWSADGQSILLPTSPTVIPDLVHTLFADGALAQENASVAVLNGTSTSGVAGDVEGTLQKLGFHTVMAGNADSSGYVRSEVIENTAVQGPGDYTARRLQRLFDASLVREPLGGQSAKIVLIVGSDFPTP